MIVQEQRATKWPTRRTAAILLIASVGIWSVVTWGILVIA